MHRAFRRKTCRLCGRPFVIGVACDRGQSYRAMPCRAAARRRVARAANARHQRRPEGRLDHRDRQGAYRMRWCDRSPLRTGDQGRSDFRVTTTPECRGSGSRCLVWGWRTVGGHDGGSVARSTGGTMRNWRPSLTSSRVPRSTAHHKPSSRHHRLPAPSQITMFTTLMSAPSRHQSPISTFPIRTGSAPVPCRSGSSTRTGC